MPAPIPEDKRAAILRDIEADHPRNQIARDHKVSVSTVTKFAKQVGHEFDRSHTKNATAAAVADNKSLRAATSRRFLEEANLFLDDLHRPHTVFNFGGKDNTFNSMEFPEPPTADKRNLMVSAATAFDKHLVGEKHDADSGAVGARSVLGALAAGLQLAAEQIDGQTPTEQ